MKLRLAAILTLAIVANMAQAQSLIKVSDSAWAKTSINTTSFRGKAIVTHKKTQYTAFYDASGNMVLASRKLGSKNWILQKTSYNGNVSDAHNGISLGVDGKGALHVSWDHHGHPLKYAKANAAGSLELSPMSTMIGRNENHVTYPEFYTMPDGDLLFVYRDGSSGNGNLVMNRYDVKNDQWIRIQSNLIDGEGKRNAYWQLCIDKAGGIHISWVWRETSHVETNHDLCYAYSPDGGNSWYHSDRTTPYTLPIRANNAQYICHIPQRSELINQTSMACDDNTYPYIATYWRDENSSIPQYRLIYFDGSQWHQQQVGIRITPFSLSGSGSKKIPIARPSVAVENNRSGKPRILYIFRDEERNNKVSMAYCDDLKAGKWYVTDMNSFSVGSWEPSYDTKLWAERKRMHIFVQHTGQGDGETIEDIMPQPIYILEVPKLKRGCEVSEKWSDDIGD